MNRARPVEALLAALATLTVALPLTTLFAQSTWARPSVLLVAVVVRQWHRPAAAHHLAPARRPRPGAAPALHGVPRARPGPPVARPPAVARDRPGLRGPAQRGAADGDELHRPRAVDQGHHPRDQRDPRAHGARRRRHRGDVPQPRARGGPPAGGLPRLGHELRRRARCLVRRAGRPVLARPRRAAGRALAAVLGDRGPPLLRGSLADPTTAFATTGRLVGVVALAAAVVLPALVPHLPTTFLADGLGQSDNGRGGNGSNVRLASSVDIAQRPRQPLERPRAALPHDVRPDPAAAGGRPRRLPTEVGGSRAPTSPSCRSTGRSPARRPPQTSRAG